MTTITVSIDDETFPIVWEAVTAGQQIRASERSGGVSVADVVAAGAFAPNDLREVVAMLSLAVEQMGVPIDVVWMSNNLTLGQAIGLHIGDDAEVDPELGDLPPDLAAAVRAHRSADIARQSAAGVIT